MGGLIRMAEEASREALSVYEFTHLVDDAKLRARRQRHEPRAG